MDNDRIPLGEKYEEAIGPLTDYIGEDIEGGDIPEVPLLSFKGEQLPIISAAVTIENLGEEELTFEEMMDFCGKALDASGTMLRESANCVESFRDLPPETIDRESDETKNFLWASFCYQSIAVATTRLLSFSALRYDVDTIAGGFGSQVGEMAGLDIWEDIGKSGPQVVDVEDEEREMIDDYLSGRRSLGITADSNLLYAWKRSEREQLFLHEDFDTLISDAIGGMLCDRLQSAVAEDSLRFSYHAEGEHEDRLSLAVTRAARLLHYKREIVQIVGREDDILDLDIILANMPEAFITDLMFFVATSDLISDSSPLTEDSREVLGEIFRLRSRRADHPISHMLEVVLNRKDIWDQLFGVFIEEAYADQFELLPMCGALLEYLPDTARNYFMLYLRNFDQGYGVSDIVATAADEPREHPRTLISNLAEEALLRLAADNLIERASDRFMPGQPSVGNTIAANIVESSLQNEDPARYLRTIYEIIPESLLPFLRDALIVNFEETGLTPEELRRLDDELAFAAACVNPGIAAFIRRDILPMRDLPAQDHKRTNWNLSEDERASYSSWIFAFENIRRLHTAATRPLTRESWPTDKLYEEMEHSGADQNWLPSVPSKDMAVLHESTLQNLATSSITMPDMRFVDYCRMMIERKRSKVDQIVQILRSADLDLRFDASVQYVAENGDPVNFEYADLVTETTLGEAIIARMLVGVHEQHRTGAYRQLRTSTRSVMRGIKGLLRDVEEAKGRAFDKNNQMLRAFEKYARLLDLEY